MRIEFKSFSGIMPKLTPRQLPHSASQTCNNAWLVQHDLQPLKAPSVMAALPDANRESIYLWRRGGSEEWLSWTSDVNVARAPIADDQYATIYYTDGTTLHRVRWISDAKVETADVSTTAPGKTIPVRYEFVTTRYIRLCRSPSTGTYDAGSVANPTSVSVDGNAMTVTGPLPSGTATDFALLVPTHAGSAGNLEVGNLNIAVAIKNPSGATTIGSFVVTGYTTTDTTITYTCDIQFTRTESQTYYYCQTTVDAYGQESPPGALSDPITLTANEWVRVSMGTGRLYRSATGSNQDGFFYVADASANYDDFLGDAQLAEKMPIIENPPIAMTGLVSAPGGFFAAFNGKDLYFSEPYLPYSWPTRYRLTMDYDIVGLAVNGNDIIVLTKGNPYYISGAYPEIMNQSKVPIEQSCISKRSITFSENTVCYASPDGLCGIKDGDVQVLTKNLYTQAQWMAINPDTMLGAVHEGRYIGFTDTTSIIVDFREANTALSTTDETASGVYVDLENDDLYLIQVSNITEWMGSDTNLIAAWRSAEYQSVRDSIFTSAKIIAATYTSISFKIFADNVQVWSTTVTSDRSFRVPKLDRSTCWSIEIDTADRIYQASLASSMSLLREGDTYVR